MEHHSLAIGLLVALLIVPACSPEAPPEPEGPSIPNGLPEIGSSLEQPQIVATPNNGLVLTWTGREGQSVDLFLSRLEGDTFTPPVRVNESAGAVNRLSIDEMRQAIAAGPDGQVAIAWTDQEFDIRLSRSRDGGRNFGPSLRLNRDEGDALQEFPAIAFDGNGTLHAVWLDPRSAPADSEEPADLYYTSVSSSGEPGPEINLTADQDSSVCGCCLPDLQTLTDGTIRITFRNTTPEGYRDPFRIVGSPGAFSPPMPVSPPVWQIDACPVAGPIGVGNRTLWLDSSLGSQRLLSAVAADAEPETVLEDSDTELLLLPPRRVSGLSGQSEVVLVPMADNSRLIVPDGDSWRVIADDLPFWVTSAAVHQDQLMMVGTAQGFQFESRPFDMTRTASNR